MRWGTQYYWSTRFVEVRETALGKGVFAARKIHFGRTIGEVLGRVVNDPDYSSDYCIDLGESTSLEPDPPFRFLNHACEPNCVLVSDDSHGRGLPKLTVEALTDIDVGDELTIDYAWTADQAIPCLCTSSRCRGWIVAEEERDLICDLPLTGGATD